MNTIATELPGVLIIEPRVFSDPRGFFLETFRQSDFDALGIDSFVQDNHSRSQRGVLRGLHYQLEQPQGKLVRVTQGQVFDVAVDIRRGSPTFGRWTGCLLDDKNLRLFYIPPGFAHGFCVVSDTADFLYKCTAYYDPKSEFGIAWDDPDIAIDWPLRDVSLSDRDRVNPALKDQSRLPIYQAGVTPSDNRAVPTV